MNETQDADGDPIGAPTYSLLLEDVDGSFVEALQGLDGSDGEVQDGNLRIDFGAADLERLQTLAREKLADQVAVNGDGRPTADEIGESLADGDGVVEYKGVQYGFGPPYTELAEAGTPAAMLIGLYHMGGGDASGAAYELEMLTLDAGDLPGTIVTPDCG